MDSDISTSLEQLDAMLADGRITQPDYDTLKSALTGAPAPRPGAAAGSRPRLTKSWTHRQIGGVCGGMADYFGLNANCLRWVFVLGALLSGGTAVFIYLALYFVLPWSERPAKGARGTERRGTLAFAVRLGLWVVLAGAVWAFLASRVVGVCSQFGLELGAAAKWSVVSMQAMLCSPAGWTVTAAAFAALVGVRHVISDSPSRRRAYDLAVYSILAAVLLFWIVSLYGCLWNIPKIVGRE
jgi:phage shock protein PspC (stress-responsive transcriptional regulator)